VTIPIATLGVECHLTNPPEPLGIMIKNGVKTVAVVTLEGFDRAFAALDELRKAKRHHAG
jgi:hypothetical protein